MCASSCRKRSAASLPVTPRTPASAPTHFEKALQLEPENGRLKHRIEEIKASKK